MSPPVPKGPRRHDIDRLRILAMLAVFLFHTAHFFDPLPWHLKNPENSISALVFVGFLDGWLMELFFLLSGFAARYSLSCRGPGRFIRERAVRLLVPVYTVGMFILLPPQRYWDLQTQGVETGPFMSWYPSFLTGIHLNPLSPHFLSPWAGHLWFLRFLFLISVFTLPVLLLLNSESGTRLWDKLGEKIAASRFPWQPLLVLVLLRVLLPARAGVHDWNAMAQYALFFLCGYLLAMNDALWAALRKWIAHSLWTGLAAFGLCGVMLFSGFIEPWNPMGPLPHLIYGVVSSINTVAWVTAILGLGHRFLNTPPGPGLPRLNEAVLPFYILHQTAILAAARVIGPTDWPMAVKFMAIAASAFIMIVVVYEGCVRPFNSIRFLFGMRPGTGR